MPLPSRRRQATLQPGRKKVTATGIAADPVTGGYWIARSNSGVDAFAAPWYGSMAGQVPAGQSVTGIAGE